ncbi:MAG TPA: flavodoxin domain-containing protein [Methanobacterium sp.]|nr:flavodoxin domain-containing protein [Methanobacterium sp.]
METRKILKIAGLGIVAVLVAFFVVMGFVFFDGISYTATSSEKLNPTGTEVGKALVVYDPGISGNAKNVATAIAKDLQLKGYSVDLAGINSAIAKNTSGYNIIVVGGPIYAGNASASVQSYLKALKPDNNAKIGVFATGQDADILKNQTLLLKEVAPLPNGSNLKIVSVTKVINLNETNQKATDFVNALIK